jgi:hypothetical protein
MRCEDEAVDRVEGNSTRLVRFVGELLAKDSEHVGWGDGSHVVDNNLQFLGKFVFERIGFDRCQGLQKTRKIRLVKNNIA